MLQTQTTITTETITVEATNFTVTTFEQSMNGFCDICGDQETGNQKSLIDSGWELARNHHFCPNCNL